MDRIATSRAVAKAQGLLHHIQKLGGFLNLIPHHGVGLGVVRAEELGGSRGKPSALPSLMAGFETPDLVCERGRCERRLEGKA